MSKLTGKTRCRLLTRLWCQPLLVLQVEVENPTPCACIGLDVCANCHAGKAAGTISYFRDATVEDLQQIITDNKD